MALGGEDGREKQLPIENWQLTIAKWVRGQDG
jgi:hypothetical protein